MASSPAPRGLDRRIVSCAGAVTPPGTAAPPDGGSRHTPSAAARLTSSLTDNYGEADAQATQPLPPRPSAIGTVKFRPGVGKLVGRELRSVRPQPFSLSGRRLRSEGQTGG